MTGGTRGLGRAIVRTLAQAGADVVVSSRKQEACEEAAAEVRRAGPTRARARLPRRPVGRDRPARRRGVRRVRPHRRARQQRRAGADLPESAGRDGGAVGQDDRREPQRPVPADVARRRADVRGRRRLDHQHQLDRRRPADARHPPVRRREGRPERAHRRLRRRVRPEGARERVMPGPFRTDISRTGTTRRSPSARGRSRCAARASRTSSRPPFSTSRATRRASRPVRCSRSTAARSGAWRAAAIKLADTEASTTATGTGPAATASRRAPLLLARRRALRTCSSASGCASCHRLR